MNGTPMALVVSYLASDAGATTWAAHDGAGVTLSKVENGTDYSVGVDTGFTGSDTGLRFGGGDYYQATDGGVAGDITTEDLVAEVVYQPQASGAGLALITKDCVSCATAGWAVYTGTNNVIFGVYDSGATHSALSQCIGSTIGLQHCMFFLDRSGGSGQFFENYSNGGTPTVGNDPATVGSITNSKAITVGAWGAGGAATPTTATFVSFKLWKCSGCLNNSSLTESASTAARRASQLMGVFPPVSIGSPVPTVMARNSFALLPKMTAGVMSYFPVSANWMRVGRNATTTGYLSENARNQLVLQNEDISNATNWTKTNAADTFSLDSVADPYQDGLSKMDGIIPENGTNTEHGVTQVVTLTASTYVQTGDFKAGVGESWAYVSDDTVANANSYFDVANCAFGTKGAGVIDQFAESLGNGQCRVGISFTGTAAPHTLRWSCAEADNDRLFVGNGASVACSLWGMDATRDLLPYVPCPTTTTACTRQFDDLEFDPVGNTNISMGSVVMSAWAGPAYTTDTLHIPYSMDDGVATRNAISLASTTVKRYDSRCYSNSVLVGQVVSTNNSMTAVLQTTAQTWTDAGDDFYLDGSASGTRDSATAAPIAPFTRFQIGQQGGGNNYVGLINRIQIYRTLHRPVIQ